MNSTLKMWRKLSPYPAGKWTFSKAVCMKAPYFSTINPCFEELDVGHAVVRIKEHRAIHNHIGSVHAIAMCNLAEVCAGVVSMVSLPEGMRWIPAGMTVRYLGRAKGVLRGYATMREIVPGEKGSVPVIVEVKNEAGEVVFDAEIAIHVSPMKKA
ncbi:MAG: hotdog fold domain-containing protein [Zhongshania sp.]|uniref:hotdog fold domain-containing protein n=1 Tax=Zhongshania sp. TaxID=1971902 RepID=UPI00261055FB|nr:hotdog fold domain-containing protein [Zhongshania sp.]MDF1692088.1 hotdog fold domain-containing protein [Zhongshania sp.]